jgi:hypothetical protein
MVALTQRANLLQEENNELYELLKHSETGRLKEEVRGLRRAMKRMESALNGEQRVRALTCFCPQHIDISYRHLSYRISWNN